MGHLGDIGSLHLQCRRTGKVHSLDINQNEYNESAPPELRKVKARARLKTWHDNSVSADPYEVANSKFLFPFAVFSSSVDSGYASLYWNNDNTSSVAFNNMHDDQYGRDRERPLQGPFTEKYVGGNQHRHVDLNRGPTLAVERDRPEAWYLKIPDGNGISLLSLLSEPFQSGDIGDAESQYLPDVPSGWFTDVNPTGSLIFHGMNPAGWRSGTGHTPTLGTGPDGAATAADAYYMYAETSYPNAPGRAFGLITPQIDGTEVSVGSVTGFTGSFKYHMYGQAMGILKVQITTQTIPTAGANKLSGSLVLWGDLTVNWNGTEATELAGPQQATATEAWRGATFDLAAYQGTKFNIRFLYVGGITHQGDCAIFRIILN